MGGSQLDTRRVIRKQDAVEQLIMQSANSYCGFETWKNDEVDGELYAQTQTLNVLVEDAGNATGDIECMYIYT